MTVFYEFEDVDAFTAGAVGQPGSRVFFLQARHGKQRVAIKCEKQQVAAIADYLSKVLSDLPPPDDKPVSGALDLVEPVEQAFVLGPIGLGYDRSTDRIVLQLDEVVFGADEDDDDDDDQGDGGHVRVYVTRGQAASFVEHAETVVAAGRPDCRWCGLPVDPDGHPCPRMN